MRKVSGMNIHQNFIRRRSDSGIYHAKNVTATTEISILIDFAGKVVPVSSINFMSEVSSSDK